MMTADIHVIEEEACKGSSLLHTYLRQLVHTVRHLQHQLDDPNYIYSGRIHRQAIISRDKEIDLLRAENKKLKEKIAKDDPEWDLGSGKC